MDVGRRVMGEDAHVVVRPLVAGGGEYAAHAGKAEGQDACFPLRTACDVASPVVRIEERGHLRSEGGSSGANALRTMADASSMAQRISAPAPLPGEKPTAQPLVDPR